MMPGQMSLMRAQALRAPVQPPAPVGAPMPQALPGAMGGMMPPPPQQGMPMQNLQRPMPQMPQGPMAPRGMPGVL